MTPTQPPTSPPTPDPDSFEQDAKQLAKLTTNFYAALNDLLPAAIRASKRGKHGLLRLISRKLPRPKLQPVEDLEDDRRQDDDAGAIAECVRQAFERPQEMPTPSRKIEDEKRETAPEKLRPQPPAETPQNTRPPQRSSGAPRSLNEEPWPGQSNFPRPVHRRLKKPT